MYFSIIKPLACIKQAQLASHATTMSATKEEVKKLKIQLTSQASDFETLMLSLNKQHDTHSKILEEKVGCFNMFIANLVSGCIIIIIAININLYIQ